MPLPRTGTRRSNTDSPPRATTRTAGAGLRRVRGPNRRVETRTLPRGEPGNVEVTISGPYRLQTWSEAGRAGTPSGFAPRRLPRQKQRNAEYVRRWGRRVGRPTSARGRTGRGSRAPRDRSAPRDDQPVPILSHATGMFPRRPGFPGVRVKWAIRVATAVRAWTLCPRDGRFVPAQGSSNVGTFGGVGC